MISIATSYDNNICAISFILTLIFIMSHKSELYNNIGEANEIFHI